MSAGTTGPQFGRYQLRAIIGDGGFATVYRAWDPMLGREVALKALLPHLARRPDVRDRFLAEARSIALLRHPNIVSFFDVGEDDGQPFFAMELIEGPTLAALLSNQGAQPLDRVVHILRSLTSAVDYLHGAGLVHRDIKAANVMLDAGDRVMLMDFGVVRALDNTQYTHTGASLGTPETMAPEQVRGLPAGPPADVYALGIMAYQLRSGRPPFVGDTAYVLHAQVYEPPPPLHELQPGLDERVYAAIDMALEKDPARRPATAGAFAEAIAAVLPPAPAGPPPSRQLEDELHAAGRGAVPPVPVAPAAESLPGAYVAIDTHRTPWFRTKRGRVLAGVPVVTLVVVVVAVAIAVSGDRSSGRAAPTAQSGTLSLTAGTLAATRAPAASSLPASTTVSTPAPPKLPDQVLDAEILRAGARTVQRSNVPGERGDPGQIVLYSAAPSADGCDQPYVDLFRPNAAGKWVSAWDATKTPGGSPLLPDVHQGEHGCSPGVRLFVTRPLAAGEPPRTILAVAASDGSLRLTVFGWDAVKQQVSTLYDLHTTPGAAANLGDGQPATLGLSENAYPSLSSGLNPDYSRPTGKLSELLAWQGGGFTASDQKLAPNCLSGKLTDKSAINAGRALQWACTAGSPRPYAAAGITGDTAFAGGVNFDDLQAGDDVTVTIVESSFSPSDPLSALPVAATLQSNAAAARKQAQTATPAPRPAAPQVAAPQQPASVPRPVAPAPAPPAPQPQAPAQQPTQTLPQPIPAQTVQPRPIPPQPASTPRQQ